MYRRLWEIFWDELPARQAQTMTPRVRDTGRESDRPPVYSPFNFGINRPWYDKFKDATTHSVLLRDWYTHPDPEGFEAQSGTGGEEEGDSTPPPDSSPIHE